MRVREKERKRVCEEGAGKRNEWEKDGGSDELRKATDGGGGCSLT